MLCTGGFLLGFNPHIAHRCTHFYRLELSILFGKGVPKHGKETAKFAESKWASDLDKNHILLYNMCNATDAISTEATCTITS